MAILITGGAGYIGSHCVLLLLPRNEKVIVLDNLSTGFRNAVHMDADFVHGDVGDKSLVKRIVRESNVDTIIHLAASSVVSDSTKMPLDYYLNNTSKSRNLIEAAVESQIQNFIFSSTAAVYGAGGDTPLSETNALCPISPYGFSKMATERMLMDAALAGGLRYVILRYFNVAGADPLRRAGQSSARATHLIKVACQAVFSLRPKLVVFGGDYPTRDGTCIRDYIHVADLANAHVSALDYLRAGGESHVFNCGYERGHSVLEVLRTVEDVSGRRIEQEFAGRRPGDPACLVASNSKICKLLSWRPAFDNLNTIVAHALAWEEQLASWSGSRELETTHFARGADNATQVTQGHH